MKNSIHYSPEAQNDLDEIWEYITLELCNPQAAENTVNKIIFLTSGNYMVFYRVNGQDVYVDRVLYNRRDYLRILFPDLPQNDNDG